MPAGDAGLERQTVDTAALRQRLAEVGQLMQEFGNTIHVDGETPLAQALVDVAKSVPSLLTEVDRLQVQLAAQQAVVDTARELGGLIDGYRWSSHTHDRAVYETNEKMRQALRAVDKAQAAQPEGELG